MDIYSTFLRICTLTRALRDIRQTLQGPRDMIHWGVWEFEEFRTLMTLQNIVSQRSKPTSKALVIQSFSPFCSFLFLTLHPAAPGFITQQLLPVKTPGEKNWGFSYLLYGRSHGNSRRARRAAQLMTKRQTSAIFT